MSRSAHRLLCLLSAFLGAACSSTDVESTDEGASEDRTLEEPSFEGSPLHPARAGAEEERSLPFQVFVDEAPLQTEPIRRLITSAGQYLALVGHPPPIAIQWSREWVVFYGAGTKPTGGYQARIEGITSRDSGRLRIVTKLVAPGPDCVTTMVITNPQVFARFRRPVSATGSARFHHNDEVRACAACAGAATRNPETGLCECNALGLCIPGYVWSSDPSVCGCVPVVAGGPTSARPGGGA